MGAWKRALCTVALTGVALLGGCSGAAEQDESAGGAGAAVPAQDAGGAGAGTVTLTVLGATYEVPAMKCSVSENLIKVSAGSMAGGLPGQGSGMVTIEASWGTSDADYIEFYAASTNSSPPAPFELYADPERPQTSHTVEVEGASATVTARMSNEHSTAADGSFVDATILIECDGDAAVAAAPQPSTELTTESVQPTSAAPAAAPGGGARISFTVDGATQAFDYPTCPMAEPAFGFVAINGSGYRLFVGDGNLSFLTPEARNYMAAGVSPSGDASQASWRGTVTAGGQQATAELTIACSG